MSKFYVTENTLEDGSNTYDVWLSNTYGLVLVAEAPSQGVAEQVADCLNKVRASLLSAGSDQEAIRIGTAVRAALSNG